MQYQEAERVSAIMTSCPTSSLKKWDCQWYRYFIHLFINHEYEYGSIFLKMLSISRHPEICLLQFCSCALCRPWLVWRQKARKQGPAFQIPSPTSHVHQPKGRPPKKKYVYFRALPTDLTNTMTEMEGRIFYTKTTWSTATNYSLCNFRSQREFLW